MTSTTDRILLVEDHQGLADALKIVITRGMGEQHQVDIARSFKAATRLLEALRYMAIVLDLRLPPESADMATFKAILRLSRGTPIVVMSGADLSDFEEGQLQAVAFRRVSKSERNWEDRIVEALREILDSQSVVFTPEQARMMADRLERASDMLACASARASRALETSRECRRGPDGSGE